MNRSVPIYNNLINLSIVLPISSPAASFRWHARPARTWSPWNPQRSLFHRHLRAYRRRRQSQQSRLGGMDCWGLPPLRYSSSNSLIMAPPPPPPPMAPSPAGDHLDRYYRQRRDRGTVASLPAVLTSRPPPGPGRMGRRPQSPVAVAVVRPRSVPERLPAPECPEDPNWTPTRPIRRPSTRTLSAVGGSSTSLLVRSLVNLKRPNEDGWEPWERRLVVRRKSV